MKTLEELMKIFNLKSVEEIEERYKKVNINIGFFVSPVKEEEGE